MPPRGKSNFPGPARTVHAQPQQDSWTGRIAASLRKTSVATLLQIFGAFAAAAIALLVWRVSKHAVRNLSDASPDALRDVFFGDKPWVVYCANEKELRGEAAVPQLYTLLHQDLGAEASFGIMDCSTKLPSGKSVLQRFNIDPKWSPAIAVFVPWDKHRQLPPSAIKDHVSARRFLRPLLDPIPYHVQTLADLKKRCEGATCVVLASSTDRYKHTKDLQRAVVRANPRVRFVHIDRSALRLPELGGDEVALSVVVLKKLSEYRAYTGAAEVAPIRQFIQASISEDAQFSPLPAHGLMLSETAQEKVERRRQRREQSKQSAGDEHRPPVQEGQAEPALDQESTLTPEQLQRQREMKRREELDRMHEEIVTAVDPDEYEPEEEEEEYEEDAVIDLD